MTVTGQLPADKRIAWTEEVSIQANLSTAASNGSASGDQPWGSRGSNWTAEGHDCRGQGSGLVVTTEVP